MTDSELSYEQARTELATVVERLEAGGTSLEDSLALWERGEELAAICQRWLDGARTRLAAARERRESGATDRGTDGAASNGGNGGQRSGSAR